MKNVKKQPSVNSSGKKRVISEKMRRKLILRRVTVVVLTALALLALLLGVLALVKGCVNRNQKPAEKKEIVAANDINPDTSRDYYAADNDGTEGDTYGIYAEPEYAACDRAIHFEVEADNGSYSYVLGEHDPADLTEGERFFLLYFRSVIEGDCDTYHTFFSDVYRENALGYKNFEEEPDTRVFPMQRLYDIRVRRLWRTEPGDANYTHLGKPVVYGVYEVSYKILNNTGDFRVDLPQGGTVPLVFETMTENAGTPDEKTFINGMYRYIDIPAEQGKDDPYAEP